MARSRKKSSARATSSAKAASTDPQDVTPDAEDPTAEAEDAATDLEDTMADAEDATAEAEDSKPAGGSAKDPVRRRGAAGKDPVGRGATKGASRKKKSKGETGRTAGGEVPEPDELRQMLLDTLGERRDQEIERGVNLVGPHRDDLVLGLGPMPAKGYASHGESWSFALGLRLAAYHLLRHDLGDDPVLVLDDVFAELDSGRRERLAAMIADCEQVLITAAVPEDVPESMAGRRYSVTLGEVSGP